MSAEVVASRLMTLSFWAFLPAQAAVAVGNGSLESLDMALDHRFARTLNHGGHGGHGGRSTASADHSLDAVSKVSDMGVDQNTDGRSAELQK